jgi:hypothetical protein
VILIIVVLEVKLLLDCPVAELYEKYIGAAVRVAGFPLRLGVAHVDAPPFDHGLGCQKLSVTETVVARLVNTLEGYEVLVVLPQILKQPAVLCLLDVVVSV